MVETPLACSSGSLAGPEYLMYFLSGQLGWWLPDASWANESPWSQYEHRTLKSEPSTLASINPNKPLHVPSRVPPSFSRRVQHVDLLGPQRSEFLRPPRSPTISNLRPCIFFFSAFASSRLASGTRDHVLEPRWRSNTTTPRMETRVE